MRLVLVIWSRGGGVEKKRLCGEWSGVEVLVQNVVWGSVIVGYTVV